MALSEAAKAAVEARFAQTRKYRRKTIWAALQARIHKHDLPGKVNLLIEAGLTAEQAEAFARGDKSALAPLSRRLACVATTITSTVDYLPISFLAKGAEVARAVGRLVNEDENPDGTAFMISNSLLFTAGHAIPCPKVAKERFVQFDFDVDVSGAEKRQTGFSLCPDRFFHTNTDETLDYSIVALGSPVGSSATPPVGYCPLPATEEHHIEAFVNIIQHPLKARKQVVVRENQVLCIPKKFLYYQAETDDGSSGSPVFNDDWELVGHHRYGTSRQALKLPNGCMYPDAVGEGVPATSVVADLRVTLPKLSSDMQFLLAEALAL